MMYVWAVRTKKDSPTDPLILQDKEMTYGDDAAMVRTQVYLTRAEHDFLCRQGEMRGEGMSAILREIIDEKMRIPEDAWTNNPLLAPTPEDPGEACYEDGSLNHDHYAYGAPKKYHKARGKWVLKAEVEP